MLVSGVIQEVCHFLVLTHHVCAIYNISNNDKNFDENNEVVSHYQRRGLECLDNRDGTCCIIRVDPFLTV